MQTSIILAPRDEGLFFWRAYFDVGSEQLVFIDGLFMHPTPEEAEQEWKEVGIERCQNAGYFLNSHISTHIVKPTH